MRRVHRPRIAIRGSVADKLSSRVRRHASGCLLWMGYLDEDGYGRFSLGGKNWRAHRLSWVLHGRELTEDLVIRHRCDVPACVAIEHLEIGTRGDNRRDSIERGRAVVMIRQTELEKLRAEIGRLRHRLESRGRLLRYWRSKARGSIGRRAVETDAPAVAVSSRGATRAASNAEPAALAGRAPNAALGPGQPTAAPAAC